MVEIRTVLCPVDFSGASARQLEIAGELCRAFGARLVLHHNLTGATSAGVGWMWAAEHRGALTEDQAAARLHELLAALPAGVEGEARLTHGPATQAVLAVGEAVAADLIVISTHGASDDHHTSTSELILEHSNRSLLVLHEAAVDHDVPHFAESTASGQVVLVPTDLAPGSRAALQCAFDLAARLPVALHLLHVAESGRQGSDGRPGDPASALRALVPPELAGRVELHVEPGDPSKVIPAAAVRLGAACIVMGEHSHRTLWSWLRRDHSQGVLHQAPCPVWYVPNPAA
jgi:nucleotide-binding universal stress UspA family protein